MLQGTLHCLIAAYPRPHRYDTDRGHVDHHSHQLCDHYHSCLEHHRELYREHCTSSTATATSATATTATSTTSTTSTTCTPTTATTTSALAQMYSILVPP
jgi:hypothetical protein